MQAWMPHFGVMAHLLDKIHLLANSLCCTVSQLIKPRTTAQDWLPQIAGLVESGLCHGLWQLIKLKWKTVEVKTEAAGCTSAPIAAGASNTGRTW
ncbi:hypothetical protein V5799_027088 [Amblyomma americanum]|uniref:Secreted protein n=1 Tax=Amblyomma americanum TaxID=6943 RepID=A0AAQ4DGQ5_AMBAM